MVHVWIAVGGDAASINITITITYLGTVLNDNIPVIAGWSINSQSRCAAAAKFPAGAGEQAKRLKQNRRNILYHKMRFATAFPVNCSANSPMTPYRETTASTSNSVRPGAGVSKIRIFPSK